MHQQIACFDIIAGNDGGALTALVGDICKMHGIFNHGEASRSGWEVLF